jgi:probable HAF family extracellular repeat protein
MNMKQPLNTRYKTLETVPAVVRAVALLVLMLNVASAAGTATITGIAAPGSPFSVIALNTNGQVAGYFFDLESSQRGFLWSSGAAVDLGSLGGTLSVANCLNNAGQVVGFSSIADDAEFHACIGTASGLLDLGTLGGVFSAANGLNDSGTAVGQSYIADNSAYHAFVAASGGALQDLGTLGGSSSSATAINNAGDIIGDSFIMSDSEVHAFLHRGGVMRDLGTLGGSSSTAFALNALGQVTGESRVASEDTHAFRFDGDAMLNLGTLGGTRSTGRGINNQGEVIGDSTTADEAESHGFIYRSGTLQDLGTLGGWWSTASDVNNLGQVVGSSFDANQQQRAFMWENGVMTDLNTLLPPNSDWELTSAQFINDNRQIAGEGLYQNQSVWFLLTLAANENHPPVANAGSDQAFACGVSEAHVTLDGSTSSDPDGDAVTFEWTEGGVVLGNSAVLQVTLGSGTHTIALRVTDTHGASAEDSVSVAVGADDTTPPMVECPAGRTVPAGERGRALVPNFLEGLTASDNCTAAAALVKEQTPAAGIVVGCGTYAVTLTVVDAAGNRTTCSATLSVMDVTSPVVRCPEEIFRRARTNCQAAVPDLTERIFALDNCTPRAQLVITQRPAPGTLVERGRHEITVTVADAAGNTTVCTTVLHVLDLTRPIFTSLTATPNILVASGKMVTVNLTAAVRDNCDSSPHCQIVFVSSSERQRDGESPDWRVTGEMTVQLRAQLTSKRGTRVYKIVVACIDASGNFTLRSVHVKVTRDQLAQTD